MSEANRQAMEAAIVANPGAAPVIRGTGGIRKLRWMGSGRGKRGGIRTIYFHHAGPECSNNGIGRIALKVGDIDTAYGDLKDKGVAFLSPPQTLHFPGFGDFKFCCFRDPDGIVLELVEV